MAPEILSNIWSYIEWFYNDKIHFLQLHYLYILTLILITSGCFYHANDPHWNYIDALFMATSSATNTGLNTINMSELSTWQQIVMYFGSFLGSHVMISIIIVHVRKHYFSKRFEDILRFNKAQQLRETNKRKFEKNVQEIEQQRRKSLNSVEKSKRHPLRKRLSFMSVRSSSNTKDEEDNQSTAPSHSPRKKGRFSGHRPLSTSFNNFHLLSHFKRKNHNENIISSNQRTTQNARELENTTDIDNNKETQINTTVQNENNIPLQHPNISTLENGTYTFPRDNSDVSELHLMRNNSQHDSVHSVNTFPLIYQDNSKSLSDISNTNTTEQNSVNTMSHTNSTETTLSKSSSHNPNSNTNSFDNNNMNSQQPAVHFIASLEDANTAPNTVDTAHDENNNTISGSQGIAFAENIERQREIARRRLEQGRRFDDILQRIAGDEDSSDNNTHLNIPEVINIPENVEDNEEMNRVMREPIHKHELTRQQRYKLGGAEYRALVFLTILIPSYYLICSVGFGFVLRIYIAASSYPQEILRTANKTGPVNEWFFSFFCSMSAFNNLGLTQVDASMVPFRSAPGLLIPLMFLILAGNTAYALILRLIIWIIYKLTPEHYAMRRETLRYLLDHPRRCYTTLFPATQTKWLVIVLIGITAIEFVTFLALNFWLPVLAGIDWGARVLDGLFQSVANRSAGYSIVDLMELNPGTQIVFIVAMYINVYPVAISMRNSNVYQERALGIYSGKDDDENEEPESFTPKIFHRLKRSATISSVVTTSRKVIRKPDFFVMTQIQRQLTSEICWVICCIFAICVIESEAILEITPITIASVIFECVSAFGNVGASAGYPNSTASQAQNYHPLSKFVLIILMYRGRHRGLPASIDRAVLLPSEQLEQKEQQDHLLRRRNTSHSIGEGDGEAVMFYNRSRTL